MSEPRRLLSNGSDASPLERALLGAGRARREPEGMRGRVLAGVGAAVAAGSVGAAGATTAQAATSAAGAGGATGAAGAGTKAAVAGSLIGKGKILVATVALATAAGTTTYVATRSEPPPAVTVAATTATAPSRAAPPTHAIAPAAKQPPETAPEPTAVAAPEDLPIAPAVVAKPAPAFRAPAALPVAKPESEPAPRADRTPDRSAPETAPAAAAVSALREEAALVDAARRALASGDASLASARLAEADARFPRGRLGEEREALAVRVASARGEHARASRLARAFLASHPSSPLRPSIEAIARREIE